MPIYIEAHIADLHFGAMDPRVQYEILREQFLSYISQMQVLDIVSINGDIFDHKFLANSDSIMYANMFMQELIGICAQKNTTLIILSGTASHDAGQLKLFYHYIGQADIRIVEEASFIYVKGKKILVIPELYNKGKVYYNNLLHELYDACYMHGTYKGSIYGKDIENLNSDREPVFSMNNFTGCKGPIISGHVHTAGCFNEHFYYCGSPYRWRFGEEEEKGFIILCHNTDTRQYFTHFEPIKSFRYDTINLDFMLQSDPQAVINYIKKKKDEGIDYIRIKFTQNNENLIPVLKSYYRTDPYIKIEANFKNEVMVKEVEKINTENEQYSFIFDKSANPYEILCKYINMKEQDTFITPEALINLIEEEL